MLVIGSGPIELSHPRMIRVAWVTPEDLAAYIAAMDVALAPMANDAAPWFGPLKIADYQSQGTPIVASSHGDLEARIGEVGEVVASDDITQWARAVERQAGQRYTPKSRSWLKVTREALTGFIS
jgi:glycosyltransferase involved in cell wall biosynthesis